VGKTDTIRGAKCTTQESYLRVRVNKLSHGHAQKSRVPSLAIVTLVKA